MNPFHLPFSYAKRSKSIRLLLVFVILFSIASFRISTQSPPHTVDLVVSSALCFADMDGNDLYDEDHAINGQITVNSLSITATGSINSNDPDLANTCGYVGNNNDGAKPVTIIVTGDLNITSGSINTDNTNTAGRGGNITLTVGGNFTMNGGLITASNLTGTSEPNPGDNNGGDITIDVTGNVVLENGALIKTESAKFDGGAFTLTVGGTFDMQGTPGARISTENTAGNGGGGALTITVTGDIDVHPGSTITAGSSTGPGGTITITGANNVDIDGFVLSESNGSGTGCNAGHGGYISITSQKSLLISDEGQVISSSNDPGADLIHLCGCDVTIYGLVKSTGAGHALPCVPTHLGEPFRNHPTNSTAGVEVWSSTFIIIDNTGSHNGEINADLCCGGGTTGTSWIDLFAKGDITILSEGGVFAVHANGLAGINDDGGTVTIKSVNGKVTASGNATQSNGAEIGGVTTIEAKGNIDLTGAVLESTGSNTSASHGGTINLRSFGTAPATGDIISGAGSLLDVSGGTPVDGVINLTACGTIGFAALSGTYTPDPGATVNRDDNQCGGNPELPIRAGETETYVVFCGYGSLKICKVFLNSDPAHNPANKWHFTISPAINGQTEFEIDIAGDCIVIPNADPNVEYTITETPQVDPSCPQNLPLADRYYVVANTCGTGNVAKVTATACGEVTCTFTNTPPDCRPLACQWCNKGAVLSQVWQNPGNMDPTQKCIVPDILVDVTLPHDLVPGSGPNDVVSADEIGTGEPATWSIQAAVDYMNAHYNDVPFPFDDPNELFIGVTSEQPEPVVPGDPNACEAACVRPPGGDNPFGVENVVVENKSPARLNIFGCSVTMKPADASLPVFTILDGVGKVTILDLHVKGTNKLALGQGYLVKGGADGNAGKITLKNARAIGFDVGYEVRDSDVEITGSAEISNNRVGIWINGGSAVSLRTNNLIVDNSQYGIRVDGHSNILNGNDAGVAGRPNSIGIRVNGNLNTLQDNDVYGNTSDGVNVSGNNNTIKGNDIGEDGKGNGGDGLRVDGFGNLLDGNDVFENGGDGIDVSGGTALKPNVLKGNVSGEKNKGNGANGILLSGVGNNGSNPIEVEQNTTRTNGKYGIHVTGTGHQLKNNVSGGDAAQNNVKCEYVVVAGNVNSGGNKANNITLASFTGLCQGSGVLIYTNQPDIVGNVPDETILVNAYPNPFKGNTTIRYNLSKAGHVTLSVVDNYGRELQKLVNAQQPAGRYTVQWEAKGIASGAYFIQLKTGQYKGVNKLHVIK